VASKAAARVVCPRVPARSLGRDTESWAPGPRGSDGVIAIAPEDTKVFNPGFDVTPADLLTGLIAERGVCAATSHALAAMFPECSR
jgi:methylthioribose-1-phosphate isomerase